MVHLNQVVLDITAQQGSGALLGNLLCAVAGLLDGSGTGGLDEIVGAAEPDSVAASAASIQ